jgi:hypothetical protein
VPFLQAITQQRGTARVMATASPFAGPVTHPEVVAAVEQTGAVLDGLGHVVEPGATSDGLPIGVQLMAPDETILLQLAAQLETAKPWLHRRPSM